MRLTKYEPQENSMFPYRLQEDELRNELTAIHKLGQLEDVEEELGIELLVLHKAISCGAFMLTKNFDTVYCEHPKVVHYKSGWKILIHGSNLSFSSYGKTWALTKEELEND